MKKYLQSILIIALLTSGVFAQVPQYFKYQAIVRSPDGSVIGNKEVSLKIALLPEGNSEEVYSEIHNVTTNEYGLINLKIGKIFYFAI